MRAWYPRRSHLNAHKYINERAQCLCREFNYARICLVISTGCLVTPTRYSRNCNSRDLFVRFELRNTGCYPHMRILEMTRLWYMTVSYVSCRDDYIYKDIYFQLTLLDRIHKIGTVATFVYRFTQCHIFTVFLTSACNIADIADTLINVKYSIIGRGCKLNFSHNKNSE